MKVFLNEKAGTVTFSPVQADEREVINSLATRPIGEKLVQRGIKIAKGRFAGVNVLIGTEYDRTADQYRGGKEFAICGTSHEDIESLNFISRLLSTGPTGVLFYRGKTGANGTTALIFTGYLCEGCRSPMITSTCPNCSAQANAEHGLALRAG